MTPKNAGAPWTPDDVAFLERHYSTKGAPYVARHLKRTVQGVRWKAGRLALIGEPPVPATRVTIPEAEQITGLTPTAIRRRATQDGVLKRLGRKRNGKARLNTVPRKWAEQLADAIVGAHRSEYDQAGWLDTGQAAEYVGLSRAGVYRALTRDTAISRFFAGARTVIARSDGNDAILIHPQDVETARARVEDELHRSARMVTVRDLARALGITTQAAFDRCRAAGVTPVKLLTASRSFASHVTREEAEALAWERRRAA